MREPCRWEPDDNAMLEAVYGTGMVPGTEITPLPTTPVVVNPLPKKSLSTVPAKDDNPWPKGEPGGIVAGYDFKAAANCPECAMRRAKKAAAMKRWREKRKK